MALTGGEITGIIIGILLLLCIVSVVIGFAIYMTNAGTTDITSESTRNIYVVPSAEFDPNILVEDEVVLFEDDEDEYALLPEDQYLIADEPSNEQIVYDEQGNATEVYLDEEFDFDLNDEGENNFIFDEEEF